MDYSPRKIRACLRTLSAAGIDANGLIEGSGVSQSEIEALAPLGENIIAQLFDLIATRVPEGSGILCGLGARCADLGFVGYALLNCASYKQVLELWVKYSSVASHPAGCDLHLSGDSWTFDLWSRVTMSEKADRFCSEYYAAGFFAIYREITGRALRAERIDLPFAPPEDMSSLAPLDCANIAFGARATSITGTMQDLLRPLADGDAGLLNIFEARCASMLEVVKSEGSVAGKVKAILESCYQLPSAEDIADEIGLGRDELRLRLRDEGHSLQALIDGYRYREAVRMLGDRTFKIKEIAGVLGFAGPSSFHRAFRKWTGTSVGDWVETHDANRASVPLAARTLHDARFGEARRTHH